MPTSFLRITCSRLFSAGYLLRAAYCSRLTLTNPERCQLAESLRIAQSRLDRQARQLVQARISCGYRRGGGVRDRAAEGLQREKERSECWGAV